MTSLSYEKIFNDFLGNVTDFDFPSLSQSDAYEMMTEYLHKTLSVPYVRRLFSSAQLDDAVLQFNYELEYMVDDGADLDFVRNILSKGMVVEWLKPQVRSKVNISQMFSGKEQKFFSQSAHISELRSLLEDTNLEIRKEIRDRGYIYNSYLEDS